MAQAIRVEGLTPADELRQLLEAAEEQLPSLKGSRDGAVTFLLGLDRVAELWPQLEAQGVDLRPEAGRWTTIQAIVHKHAPTIVREVAAAGGFAAARSRRHGDAPVDWWWDLDREVRRNQMLRVRNIVLGLIAVILAGAAVIFVFNRVLPADPKVQASVSKLMDGQQAIEQKGDLAAAIRSFQEAAVLTPNDPDPWLWLGVAQQKSGDPAAAESSYARARQVLGSDLEFHVQRAPVDMAAGLYDQSHLDLTAALAIDPEEPRAALYLGGLLELEGRLPEAIQALEQASAWSEKRNQAELTALSRFRLAMLYQRVQSMAIGPGVPTPTPTPQ